MGSEPHPYKDKQDALMTWASSALDETIVSFKDKQISPYSYVIEIETDTRQLYLKHTPEAFSGEADILKAIHRFTLEPKVPQLIAENKDLFCYMTLHCGDIHIREYLHSDAAPKQTMSQSLSAYQAIQKDLAPHIDDINAPDWRLTQIPRLYDVFLSAKEQLKIWGLDEAKLKIHAASIKNICQELSRFAIEDSLNHSDLNGNNILRDKNSGAFFIIDWCEVNIGCPLLSQSCFLGILCGRADNQLSMADFAQLQQQLFSPYFHSHTDFQNALPLVNALTNIYYLLTNYDLARRSAYAFPEQAAKIQATVERFEESLAAIRRF